MSYEITSWDDVRRVAPSGAKFFRYRRPSGDRRKFYEKGHAFPLDPEGLADRKPAHTDGVFAVMFYTAEEATKDPDKGCPMIISPPDRDELMVEFPKGYQPGDSVQSLYLREQLTTIKSLAGSTSAPAEVLLKLLDKVSHERDLMAAEADKNRIGPMWQLILEHHQEIRAWLVAAVPAVAAVAKFVADRISNAGDPNAILERKWDELRTVSHGTSETIKALREVVEGQQRQLNAMQRRLLPAAKAKPRKPRVKPSRKAV